MRNPDLNRQVCRHVLLALHVSHQQHLGPEALLAQGALVDSPGGGARFSAGDVPQDLSIDLVGRLRGVKLQLVQRGGEEVASVASQLHRRHGGGGEAAEVVITALAEMVLVGEALQVLVCLAVQLEVSLEVALVVTKVAVPIAREYADAGGVVVLPRLVAMPLQLLARVGDK